MASYDGKGATGKVYKDMRNGQHVAVKKVHGGLMTRRDMEREYEIYKKAAHPNIVKLVERPTMHSDHKWHITMEWISGETLEKIIFNPKESSIKLTTKVTRKIITGMCEGLLHLHNNGIIHQDLKPDNIMVEAATLRAVIIDLGFAKFHRDGLNSAADIGNMAYAAPEIWTQQAQRDYGSDVWAMGKIIAELLIKDRIRHTSPAYIQKILAGNVYCDVLSRMLDGSPIPRATMAQVIGEIRKAGGVAGGVAGERRSMSDPCNMSVQLHQSSWDSGFGSLDLPPNFRLPKNLPRTGTVEFNYHHFDRKSTIKGELQMRDGRPVDVWWTKVTRQDSLKD